MSKRGCMAEMRTRSICRYGCCLTLLCGLLLLASISVSAQEEASSVPASEWKLAAPAPRGAEEVVGISARGKFYVWGGLALDWNPIGMVMEYDPNTDLWTRKYDMPVYYHHVALTEVGGRIYMFGGFSMPKQGKAMWVPVTDSWEYDPQADTWRALDPLPAALPMRCK